MTTAIVGILLLTYTLAGLAAKRFSPRTRWLFLAAALLVHLAWYATW